MLEPIYICGPTASGKSSLAIAIAERIGGEIINADAYQIYRGIETISAAPTSAQLNRVPHHLFSILEPQQPMDAQKFRLLAIEKIAELKKRGVRPIVAGGSGMYLKFLTHGPSPVPAGNPELRKKLEQSPLSDLVAQLTEMDPDGATLTNLKNRRYVTRALEICILSGKKMSRLKTDWAHNCKKIEQNLSGYVLQWQPELLRQRILIRTQKMLNNGALEEVNHLQNPSTTCEKAIGISAIKSYQAGEISLERCQELIYFATCQYAKRQRTWFKKETWLVPIPVSAQTTTNQLLAQVDLCHN